MDMDGMDMGDDMGGEGSLEDKVMDLESELEALKAEFDKLESAEKDEEADEDAEEAGEEETHDLEAGHDEEAKDLDDVKDKFEDLLADFERILAGDEEGEESSEEEEEVVAEEKHEDEKEDKALIKSMMKKQKMKEDMEADVSALLSGEELSEEFKTKATTIFEAAVIARSQSIMEEIEEALYEEFEVAVETIKEDLAKKLDDYINYMAEEFFKENQLAIEKGLRSEIVEDFIRGMKSLFEEHYIEIPEEKVDVVEELTTKVEELESSINEEIARSVEMKKQINEYKKNEAIHAVCEGLTQTQVEKLKALAENVEFTTEEEFGEKLGTLVDSYFQQPVKAAVSSALNEEVVVEDDNKVAPVVDPQIAQYAQIISKSLVK